MFWGQGGGGGGDWWWVMKMMGSGALILQNQAGIFMLLPKFSSKNGSKNLW